jgi:hypothetical protein
LPLPEPPLPPLSLPGDVSPLGPRDDEPLVVGFVDAPRPLEAPEVLPLPADLVPPDEPLRDEDGALDVSASFVGAGASVTVTAAVVGGASAVVPGAVTVVVVSVSRVAGGARSLAAGRGPFEIDRPAMAFAASPTLNAIATPAAAAAVVSMEERRMRKGYDAIG